MLVFSSSTFFWFFVREVLLEMTILPLQISKESVKKQILAGKAQVTASTSDPFALIIDGKSLAYALHDDIKNTFLELAVRCASVICCRSSPKQKALVSLLYLSFNSIIIVPDMRSNRSF